MPEEYEAGHLEYSRNVPGGQLIQTTDEHLAARNGRVVLVDDTEVRATVTASWLLQMGWIDVHVLQGGIGPAALVQDTRTPKIKEVIKTDCISPIELKTLLDSHKRVVILDLASSAEYRQGHIPGAYWLTRSSLDSVLSIFAQPEVVIVTSPEDVLAHLTAGEVRASWQNVAAKVLTSGTQSWVAAGMPIASGMERPLSRENDVWQDACEREDATYKDMQAYINWEMALLEQLKREDEIEFKLAACT